MCQYFLAFQQRFIKCLASFPLSDEINVSMLIKYLLFRLFRICFTVAFAFEHIDSEFA